ncbi:MAG: metalloregulator ArsR/SmtB family transcription factor [Sedimenticola sp.]
MDLEITAKRLAELGHSTRLAIFRYLVKCGPGGCPVGDLQKKLAIPGSTLSHHLGRLMSAGLVEQRREGRTLYCLPVYSALNEVIHFLTDECCAGSCAV